MSNPSRLGTCLSLSFPQCRLGTKQICQHSTDVTLRTLQSVYITYKWSVRTSQWTLVSAALWGNTRRMLWALRADVEVCWNVAVCTAYQLRNLAPTVTCGRDYAGIMMSIWTLCQKVSDSHPRVLWCMTHTVSSYTDPSYCSTLRLRTATAAVLSPVQVLVRRPAVSTDILRGFPQPSHRISRMPLPIRPRSLCNELLIASSNKPQINILHVEQRR
jgi:hypothetical protein